MHRSFQVFLATAAFAASAAAAQAGGACTGNCYQKVVNPPVYRDVAEQVMVRPAQTHAEIIPAQLGSVSERIVVSPGHAIARTIPAQYGTVGETVQTSAGGKVWQVTRDHHGREIGCWVYVKPAYATQYRTVMVRPAATVHDFVPPVYGTRERTVVVRPAQTVYHTAPAVYQTHTRQEMVQPASASWQPVGRPAYQHQSHGHHQGYHPRRPLHYKY